MQIIGITGGIGSGKSTVSRYLSSKGYRVIDADQIAHDIMKPGSRVLMELAARFGEDILNPDGGLNRRMLGNRAFASLEGKNQLESITHGEILRQIKEDIQRGEEEGLEVIFLDVILLFQVGLDQLCSQVWVVDAPEDIRLARVMGRDGYVPEEIRKRMTSQMNPAEMRSRGTHVIENDGTILQLQERVDTLLKGIK